MKTITKNIQAARWMPPSVVVAFTILGLLCSTAKAEWTCFNISYQPGVNIACGCVGDPINQCLPVAAVIRSGYSTCSDSSYDPSVTWYGADGGCEAVSDTVNIGSKFPCVPQLNTVGQRTCEASLVAGWLGTVGVLASPANALAWLSAVWGYYGMTTACTYCGLITCTPGSVPTENYYRTVVRATGLNSDNSPQYDYPPCDG